MHNYPPPSIIGLISKCLLGGFSILYFLFVLIQLKLITPWLLKRIKREDYKFRKDAVWLVTPLYLLIFTLFRLYAEADYELSSEILPFDHLFPSWLIYYYLGMVCRFRTIKVRPIYIFFALVVSYYLSIVVAFWLNGNSNLHNFPYTQSKLSSMFIALCVMLLVNSFYERKMPCGILSRIGEWSFGIYLLHIPIMIALQKAISLSRINVLMETFNVPFIKYICVLAFTLAILFALSKTFPKNVLRVLGLQ